MSKYFTLQIKAAKCNYQLRINDIITYIETEGFNVDFELPINHLCILGSNTVGIILLPLKNEKSISKLARFKITVYEREHSQEKESRIKISEFIAPNFNLKESTPPLTLLNSLTFENTEPLFKNYTWPAKLQKLEKDEIYNAAVSFYKQFYSMMASKNQKAIMSLLEKRMSHYSTSMYMDNRTFKELNNDFYNSMFMNEAIVAWPLEKQKLILLANFNNKLFTIKNETQESPLIFYDSKAKESHYIDFFIGKDGTDKEFSIII